MSIKAVYESDPRELAANLLATGYTAKEAADVLGVSADTVRRWQRRDPSFKQTVKNLASQVEQERRRDESDSTAASN